MKTKVTVTWSGRAFWILVLVCFCCTLLLGWWGTIPAVLFAFVFGRFNDEINRLLGEKQ